MKNNFEDLLKRTGVSPDELLQAKKELLEKGSSTDSEKDLTKVDTHEKKEEGFSVSLDIFGGDFLNHQEKTEPEILKTEESVVEEVHLKEEVPLQVESLPVVDLQEEDFQKETPETNTVVVESAPIKEDVEEDPLSISLETLESSNEPKRNAPRREAKPQTSAASSNPFGQVSTEVVEKGTVKTLMLEFVKAFNVKENLKSKSLRPWVILSSGITALVFVFMMFVSLLGTIDFAEETPQQVQEIATNVVEDFENTDLNKSTKQLMEEKSLSEGLPADFYEVKERASVFARSKSMDFVLTPMYKGEYKDLSTSVVFYDVSPAVKGMDKEKVSFAVERAIEKKDKEGLSKEHLRAIEELVRINLSSQTETKYRVHIKSIWF